MSEDNAMDATDGSPEPVVMEKVSRTVWSHDNMTEIIDSIERQVETFRSQAAYLEEEKDGISTALDTIRHSTYVECAMEGEREDILLKVDRLCMRVASVDVSIKTIRDELQEEALSQVNDIINRLVGGIDLDTIKAKAECEMFINTCLSDPESGPTDKAFENALLGCTLDDQKRIHKRLYGLLCFLQRKGVSSV